MHHCNATDVSVISRIYDFNTIRSAVRSAVLCIFHQRNPISLLRIIPDCYLVLALATLLPQLTIITAKTRNDNSNITKLQYSHRLHTS